MERRILHVDVNNAFLSWTAVHMLHQGEKIDIRTIPSIIGGDESKRSGIVLAKSPIAKKFGITTGEPICFARKKCPQIRVYPSDFRVFHYFSNALYQLLLAYTDQIERFSIDECFLDLTNALLERKLEDIAQEIHTRVEKELEFTVNIGISNNKLLAKMASDFEKPNKIHTLYPYEIEDKMWPLPISELFMLGRKTVPKFYNLGIRTIGDLAKTDKTFIINRFGKHGKMLWEYANGIDDAKVNPLPDIPKSIGNSVTLPKDFTDIDEIFSMVVALVEQVTFRLRKYKLLAGTVRIQLRTKAFVDYSHQQKLPYPTASTKQILAVAKKVLTQMYQKEPIRLIGLSVDNLQDQEDVQLSFFANDEKQNRLDVTLDTIKEKYGYHAITRAGDLKMQSIVKGKEKKLQ